jgi:uncharacterized protein YgiM (DUF1202 family)
VFTVLWSNQVVKTIPDVYRSMQETPAMCGGTKVLTSSSGSITDGFVGQKYQSDNNCTWHIIPDEGVESITLVFLSFKTVFDDDFLYVRDGAGSEVPKGDTQVRDNTKSQK